MAKLMFWISLWTIILLASLFVACANEKPTPVARSFDQFLYPEDLNGVVPAGVTGNDSALLVQGYIEQWVRQQALLHHARRNVNINHDRLDQQVETYRSGLIVYEYEQALVSQTLDTMVTSKDIQVHYDAPPDLFLLQQPILKLSYI